MMASKLMRPRHLLWFIVMLVLLPAAPTEAQIGPPRVGFIDEPRLFASSPNNTGKDGVSRFAAIFEQFGVQPVRVDLLTPIPEDIEVLMLIGPQRQLTLRNSVYIYDFLQRGGRLMIALDPEFYADVRADFRRSALNGVFETDYGVNFQRTFIAQPWFSLQTLNFLDWFTAQFSARAEPRFAHPITTPLNTYDLPVQMWGARHLFVEPFGIDSFGSTLLLTETGYGETSEDLFREFDPDPLEYDIAGDARGTLPLAAIGINERSDSVLLLLGDSQLFQNGYGLATRFDSSLPVYPGNFLLAERIAAWLLERPPGAYPSVPVGFTWIAVDGSRDEWAALGEQAPLNTAAPALAVTNDHFMYIVVPNEGQPVNAAQLTFVGLTPESAVTVSLQEDEVTYIRGDAPPVNLPDAAIAFGEHTEIRLPLRVTANTRGRPGVCLSTAVASTCQPGRLVPTELNTLDPAPIRVYDLPLGEVRTSERVNLRAAPRGDGDIIQTFESTTQVTVVGRSANSEWVLVQTGGYEGWIASFIIQLNSPLNNLPIVTG